MLTFPRMETIGPVRIRPARHGRLALRSAMPPTLIASELIGTPMLRAQVAELQWEASAWAS
jgi:hypothetical protein